MFPKTQFVLLLKFACVRAVCSRPGHRRVYSEGCHTQRGFLIPMALFIVVVLGLLAVTISKLAGSAQNIALREDITAQAFFAGESAANLALYKLFLSATTRAQTSSNCSTINGASQAFTATGLKGCAAVWTCVAATDAANTKSFYRITSAATCGSGNLAAERTIVVTAVKQ